MLFTLGGAILLFCLLPLVALNLSDNMIIQFSILYLTLVSIVYLTLVVFFWIIVSFVNGLKPTLIPAIGTDFSGIVGNVLFNYTLANTVPSWVNATHPQVNLKKCLISSVIYVTVLCKCF